MVLILYVTVCRFIKICFIQWFIPLFLWLVYLHCDILLNSLSDMTHRLQIVDNYVIVFLHAVCSETCLIKILPYGILQILINIDNASCHQSRKLLLYICYLFLI